jgi:hypothetical protein
MNGPLQRWMIDGGHMLEIDLAFPHSYEVEELRELPGTGRFDVPLIYFPRPDARPERDGLWLKVHAADSGSWVGVFEFGYGPQAVSRVVSTPDPDRACVVSRGAAYIVKAGEPDVWEEIPIFPVLDLRLISEHHLLVFADFTSLAAYGRTGLAWQSPRLCMDELKILRVTPDTIEGVGYESRFLVDIRTGRSLLPLPEGSDGKPFW